MYISPQWNGGLLNEREGIYQSMATAQKATPQDLPPPGGYRPINIDRIPLRTILKAPIVAGIISVCTFGGYYIYSLGYKELKRNEVELRSASLAMHPILLAERDRAVLKHLKVLRQEETELMKNVEGWEVGTYYGEPIYMTDKESKWREPTFYEYMAHSPASHEAKRVYQHLFM